MCFSMPFGLKYSFQNKCMSMCPNELYIFNSTQCVHECPPTDPMVSTPYLYCVSKCSESEYQFNNVCYPSCPRHLKRYNRICVNDCRETNNSLLYQDFGGGTCVEICPKNLLNSSFSCVSECPSSAKYLLDRTCYSVCPKSSPYHKTRYTYEYISYSRRKVAHFECVKTCGTYIRVINDTFCVSLCPPPTKEYNSTCYYHCPPEVPYTGRYSRCVDKCKLYLNTTCVDHCPSEMCILNETCISIDNDTMTYSRENGDKYCVSMCPKNTYQLGNICYDVCPESYIHFNYSCITICPESHPFRYKFNIDKNHRAFECVEMCNNITFVYDHQCLANCPSDRPFGNNRTCVSQCPANNKYVRSNTCVKTCSSSEYETPEYHCVAKCPASYGFAYEQKCVKECPNSYSFYTVSGGIKKCMTACPSNLITDGQRCIDWCPNIIVNGHCLDGKTCPGDYPIKKSSVRGTKCSSSCSYSEKRDQNKCVIGCPNIREFVFENSCVSECPPSHRYYKEVLLDKNCVTACDEDKLILGTKCIDLYDCSSQDGMLVLDDKYCVHSCPPNARRSFYDNTCYTVPGYVLPLFITGFLVCILITIACGIYCLGNCSFITSSTKPKVLIDTKDEDETCVLKPYAEEGSNVNINNQEIRRHVSKEETVQCNVNEDNKDNIAMEDYTDETPTTVNIED